MKFLADKTAGRRKGGTHRTADPFVLLRSVPHLTCVAPLFQQPITIFAKRSHWRREKLQSVSRSPLH